MQAREKDDRGDDGQDDANRDSDRDLFHRQQHATGFHSLRNAVYVFPALRP
jgi:hypothetical protein